MTEYEPNFQKVNWFVMKRIDDTSSTIHSHHASEAKAKEVAEALGPDWYIEQEVLLSVQSMTMKMVKLSGDVSFLGTS